MSVGIFGDYAWQYWKLGMNVMPVQDRLPVVNGFNEKWYEPRQSEEELEFLIDNYSGCNGIAVVCGHHTTVLDVDCDDEGLMALVPRTPMKRFGSKGMGYLFRGATNPKRQPPTIPLELFGRGYVVLPPSFHPKTGSAYKWVESNWCDVGELPVLSMDKWNELHQYCLMNGIVKQGLEARQGLGGDEGGRNITLTAKAWAMVKAPVARSKSLMQLVDEIMEYDQAKHPSNPWFYDPQERRRYEPREFAKRFMERTLKKANKVTTVYVASEEYQEPQVHAADEVVVKLGRMPPIPRGGIMEAIDDMVTAINGYSNPILSMAGAIPLCSLLAGHKISVGTRGHPNVFVLCTAESGAGKSAPQSAIKAALLQSFNGASLIGYDDYSSSQAITYGLPNNRKRIDIIDECKQLFMSNSNQNSHLRGMDGELCKVFSASDSFLPAKAAVNKDSRRVAIQQPYLSLCMFSTPAAFYRYYSRMLAEEGFGGRCLFFNDTTDVSSVERGLIGFSETKVDAKKMTAETIERIDYWLKMEISYVNNKGQICEYSDGGAIPKVHVIGVTKDAESLLIQYSDEYNKLASANKLPGSDDHELLACFKRAMEQHYKLLGCWVVSQSDESHVIDVAEVEWAHAMFEFSLASIKGLTQQALLNGDGEHYIAKYKQWAKEKTDISKKRFNEWVRRLLGTAETREILNFTNMLTMLELGHFEESSKSANGKIRSKWVFDSDVE